MIILVIGIISTDTTNSTTDTTVINAVIIRTASLLLKANNVLQQDQFRQRLVVHVA